MRLPLSRRRGPLGDGVHRNQGSLRHLHGYVTKRTPPPSSAPHITGTVVADDSVNAVLKEYPSYPGLGIDLRITGPD